MLIFLFHLIFIIYINRKTRFFNYLVGEYIIFYNIRITSTKNYTKDKRVKVVFKEPFATIENLVKLAKKEIAEVGFAEFKSAIISSKDECIESIKKEPLGSDFNCSSCFKWWTQRGDVRTFSNKTIRLCPR